MSANTKSMYKEYLGLFKQYSEQYGPNTCIFLMVGKFYEMYDSIDPVTGETRTSMRRAVDLLNIATTFKEKGGLDGNDGIFAGFPEQSLHKFAAVLTRNNWTVVVCDQVKDGAGSVKGRPCARILSPGTHVEMATADAPYVAGIWLEERSWQAAQSPAFAVAFFDLTTGVTSGFQGITTGSPDVWSADTLVQAIQIHNPREIIVFWRGDAVSRPTEQILRNRFGGTQALLHLRQASEQGAFETALVRKEYLARLYAPKTMLPILEYLHLDTSPLLERALIATLRFMEDHLPSSLERLQAFEPWTPRGRVHLGNNALTQLAVTGQRLEDSVLGLFQKTLTPLGKRAIRDRLLTPISDIGILRNRLDKIEHFLELPAETTKIAERYLRQIYDFPRLHRRIETYTLTAGDVMSLYQTYRRIKDLADLFDDSLFEFSSEQFQKFVELQTLFTDVFDIQKAAQDSDDLSFLQSRYAIRSAQVEQELAELRGQVEKMAKDLCIWAGLPVDALRVEQAKDQVFFITGTRSVLTMVKKIAAQRVVEPAATSKTVEVSVKSAKSVPTITPVHRDCPLAEMDIAIPKTVSGSINSPVLERLYGRVTALRAQLKQAIQEELPPLCNRLTEFSELWSFLESWISDIDISLCLATVSKARAFTKPELIDDELTGKQASVAIEGLRHPLIEDSNSRIQYVQHSISLGAEGGDSIGWLVYGMNASGKSSLMKALGIAVVLAQVGCYVPASMMKLRPFHAILTRILNQDNLWAGLSSFAVEMSELRDILVRADPFSLVLGDELCSGTESVSATALVASGIQHLLVKKTRFVFATHLHGLMDLPQVTNQSTLGIWHLKVLYDAAKDLLIYDRTLHRGPGSSLYGLEVARALHLPADFLESAQKIRRTLLGHAAEEEASGSQWNSQVIRKACELCRHPIVRDLEVHHIRPRAEANGEHFTDGSARDSLANLIVVCSKCHDKHHAGLLDIQPLQQTSAGPQRISPTGSPVASEPSVTSTKMSKWMDEEKNTIINLLQRLPNAPLKRIVFDLETQHGITISEGSLAKFRKHGLDTLS
jgi:DNA mismatch repair protein MutS